MRCSQSSLNAYEIQYGLRMNDSISKNNDKLFVKFCCISFKENEKLNLECAEKGKKIEKLNESITDLLTKNQRYLFS